MKTVDFFVGKRNKRVKDISKNLGFDKIFFVKEVSKLKEIKKEDKGKYSAILIKTRKPEILRRIIDKASNYFSYILVLGTSNEINRVALEHKKVKALVSPEHNRDKDFLHYRNSGLNQVLCKIAHDNDKIIIEGFRNVLLNVKEKRAMVIGRIAQNIMLCRKYKTKIRLGSFALKKSEMRSFFDLKSFCIAIGMTQDEARKVFLPF